MIKAVIFDMDGLLINSEPVWFRAKKELMAEINFEWTWEDQEQSMGVSTQTWVNYLYEKANKKLSKDEILNGVIERMKHYYSIGEIDLMPGANEALQFAKKYFKVGLASGSYKDLLYRAVNVNKWENIFEEILSSDDLKSGKPNPEIYLKVINKLSVAPSETVVLEDSRDGIIAGVAAGAKVIAVPGKEVPVPKETLNSAAAVIETLLDFPTTIKNLNNQ